MPQVLLGLGSNLGDRRRLLDSALQKLREGVGPLLACSRYYETRPVGGPLAQPPYLNAVAVLDCALPMELLLERCQSIETQLGRVRVRRWEPRTMDIDILLYGDQIRHSPTLEIPHPRLALRRFVLEPAVEVAASIQHPQFGKTLGELWFRVQNAPPVYWLLAPPQWQGDFRWWQEQLTDVCVLLPDARADAFQIQAESSLPHKAICIWFVFEVTQGTSGGQVVSILRRAVEQQSGRQPRAVFLATGYASFGENQVEQWTTTIAHSLKDLGLVPWLRLSNNRLAAVDELRAAMVGLDML